MKWLVASIAVGILTSISCFADVDLYSPDPQTLPADVSQEVYSSLEARLGPGNRINDHVDYQIELKNFQCEIAGNNTSNPLYTCSYGLHGEFTGDYAENIYRSMVKAGFVSDCDRHDQSCEIDPVERLSCIKTIDWLKGITYSCTIEI